MTVVIGFYFLGVAESCLPLEACHWEDTAFSLISREVSPVSLADWK